MERPRPRARTAGGRGARVPDGGSHGARRDLRGRGVRAARRVGEGARDRLGLGAGSKTVQEVLFLTFEPVLVSASERGCFAPPIAQPALKSPNRIRAHVPTIRLGDASVEETPAARSSVRWSGAPRQWSFTTSRPARFTTYRMTRAAHQGVVEGPIPGRNSGIRSIGETSHTAPNTRSALEERGTRSSPRSPRNRRTRFGSSVITSRADDFRPEHNKTRIATNHTTTEGEPAIRTCALAVLLARDR